MKASVCVFLVTASAQSALAASPAHPAFLRKLVDPAGYVVNRHPAELESICGRDDLQHVNSYDGLLGQPQAFSRLHQLAVGAMTSSTTSDDDKYCSGTLIGPDLFLTASHCIDRSTVGEFVALNYEQRAGTTEVLPQEYFEIIEVVEDGGRLDYAVLRLEGFPGYKYGWAMVRTSQAEVGEMITIIQHPSGGPKKIEVGHVAGYAGDYLTYGDLDTEPGSSGSGIIDSRGYVVGVHTNGGCYSSGGTNSGTRLNAARTSPVLSRVANVNLPFEDGSLITLTLFGGDASHGMTYDLDSMTLGLGRVEPSAWRVADLADGSFRLVATNGERSAFLTGLPEAGEVALQSVSLESTLGQRWRIVRNDEGRMVIRPVEQGEGVLWLSGLPDRGMVNLGTLSREWEVVVR